MKIQKVAIIGSGNVGGNLGARLAASGFTVRFGVRPGGDAAEAIARSGGRAEAVTIEAAVADADVVFFAVPAKAALDAVQSAGDLKGKIVVDCNNPVGWSSDGPVLAAPPEGSLAQAIAAAAPGARVLKAFNGFGAEIHLDPKLKGGVAADVLIAGDDAGAKAALADLAERAGFVPLDAGPLKNAALLEAQAVLWIHLAMKGGHGREVAFKLTGR